MKDRVQRSITTLRVVLGVVVVVQSVEALLSRGAGPHESLIRQLLPILAGAEIMGAFLILVPATARLGARVLIGVFAAAVVLHGLHGDWNVGPLLVYAGSAGVVLAAAQAAPPRESAA
jgi:hypothetical protein